ncbi:MAG: discoidin domain-containing protein [Bacteroidales bacterium]|nr:discoidin domain-containing protein [Bacteroidales bacterium]
MYDIQPEITITAIGYQTNPSNPPGNVMDKNLNTRWSQKGQTGQWIKFDMGKEVMVDAVDIAFYLGDQRVAYFDLDASSDNETFTPILSGLTSSGLTLDMERYSFGPVKARYIRIICNSNSAGGEHWNSITEARIKYDVIITGIDNVQDSQKEVSIYPNPVTDGQLIIDFNESVNKEVYVGIYDTNGSSLFRNKMNSVNGKININNLELQSGTYVLTVEEGKEILSKTFLVK